MRIQTTTLMFPFVTVDFYNSIANPSLMFKEDYNAMEEYEEESHFRWDDYIKTFIPFIQEEADLVTERMKYILKKIEVKEIRNPREYNFCTDWAVIDLEVADDWKKKFLEKLDELRNNKDCKKIIDNQYKSGSGFISFMPESLEELECELKKRSPDYDTEQLLTMCLTLLYVMEFSCLHMRFSWNCIIDNVRLDYNEFGDTITTINEEFIPLFKQEMAYKRDELYWNAWEKYGFSWRGECNYYSEFMKMCRWATKKKITIKELAM